MKTKKQKKIELLKKQIGFHKEMGNDGMAATLQFIVDKLQTALK
jgi:hypothetical protein